MRSPVFPDTQMESRELEPGLTVYECPRSGGVWIPLKSYLEWKQQQPPASAAPSVPATPELQDDSRQRALICPESGRLLLRYRAGQGLPFHLDRSPATGGTWLDKGEWEALKSKGLHASLNLIFTAAYQRQVRSAEYASTITTAFRERIGSEDFPKVEAFGAWLVKHPRRRDMICYLLDILEQNGEPNLDQK